MNDTAAAGRPSVFCYELAIMEESEKFGGYFCDLVAFLR